MTQYAKDDGGNAPGSLRDDFAKAALSAIIHSHIEHGEGEEAFQRRRRDARIAYAYADAMLYERERLA